MIAGLTALLLCQLAGELLARAFGLPVPGPVIGLVLLFVALLVRGREVPDGVGKVADALLGHLGLLFVPAGVGVVLYLPVLARDWLPISVAILLGTLVTMGVTALLAQSLLRRLDR